MHGFDDVQPALATNDNRPWWTDLTRYHWFVLMVAALGWMFDTMDQQLFTLARVPAMRELLAPEKGVSASAADVSWYGGVTTSVFLLGWATGGLGFGILGDRWGRARVMLLTILVYSLCTGLNALAWDVWSFCVFRFLTGLGVGGEFAVGVALVAEIMPARARPFALGLLQALSAVGNITAAVLSIFLGELESAGTIGSAWRIMFVVGAVPALLAILIRRKLKEPEQWQSLSGEELKKKLGSYGELFGHPRWRRNALVGMLLAFAGVVGLWGIAFFAPDLNRSVFQKRYAAGFRQQGEATRDHDFVRMVRANPGLWKAEIEAGKMAARDSGDPRKAFPTVQPTHILSEDPRRGGAVEASFKVMLDRIKEGKDLGPAEIAADAVTFLETKKVVLSDSEKSEIREHLKEYVSGNSGAATPATLRAHAERITRRNRELERNLTFWAGVTSVMLNLGAFFGIYGFTYVTHFTGRKAAFAVSFLIALLSTVMVFAYLTEFTQIFWMLPIMGFCQLSLFGGYAIYFPELFPTHLRSTGTSFCYNVGRFVAATGPFIQGWLAGSFFSAKNIVAWGLAPASPDIEPMRYAGVCMCAIFLIGLIALPFAPETKGKPLPE